MIKIKSSPRVAKNEKLRLPGIASYKTLASFLLEEAPKIYQANITHHGSACPQESINEAKELFHALQKEIWEN